MLTLEQQLRVDADVVDTELDAQETVLLHLYSKLYYTLNPTGTLIWQGVKKQLSLGQISQQLQLQFEVEAETADSSVLRLAEELCRQQLVEVVDPA